VREVTLSVDEEGANLLLTAVKWGIEQMTDSRQKEARLSLMAIQYRLEAELKVLALSKKE